ncbi:hypothetical protein [Brevibacterium sp.]|uniref:hypothetical protein n=1 Tax=Brevibacterium sp. TaxID=1701 RepID=UPI002810B1A3|nr:hypothetical protein [Brevibacterium sp.]
MTPSNRGPQPRQPRQSSGKLPSHVYRRRRITLAVLSLVVLSLLVLGVVGIVNAISGSKNDAAAESTTSQSPTPTAPVPDETAASGRCAEDKVTISAEADKKSYAEDAEPKFKLKIANNHNVTCLIEVGTKNQEFLVKKEGDVVWSSRYCAVDDENAEVSTEFAPQTEKDAQLKWNRIPVDKNCNRTKDDFGPGEYELVVKLGDKESKPVGFELEKDEATKAKEKEEAEEKRKAEKEKAETERADEGDSETESPAPN